MFISRTGKSILYPQTLVFTSKEYGHIFSTLVLQTTCRLRDVACTNLTIVFELFSIFPRPNYSPLWCKKICLLPQVKKVKE